MTIFDLVFYLFAAVTILSSVMVVSTKNIVHAAFYLLGTLMGMAGLFILLGADFVGLVQIVVYIGGILILLLFGVMLTNKITNVDIKTGTIQLIPASIIVGLFAGFLIATLTGTNFPTVDAAMNESTLLGLGNLLIQKYAIAFELLGVILLIALIGAASMARTQKAEN